jgi:hypothetical protein
MLVMNPKPVMTTRLSSECGIAREGICTRLVMAVARNNRQGGLDLPGTGDFRCVAGFFFAQLIAEGEDEALNSGHFPARASDGACKDGERVAEFEETQFEIERFAGRGLSVKMRAVERGEENLIGVDGFGESGWGLFEDPQTCGLAQGLENDGGGEDGIILEMTFEENRNGGCWGRMSVSCSRL